MVLCLYFTGLNLSNQQIAAELDLHPDMVHDMTAHLREGIGAKKPASLTGDVELDEVYVIAGHKGHPEIVAKLGRAGRCRRRLKGNRGRGTLADEKPLIFGMLQRDGDVVILMLPNVQRVTIEPLIQQTIQAGSRVYTDEYDIYNRLSQWGYTHKTANHSAGEYARDDGDGFHEVHVNTLEGFWSLLRSWLRPHRGISQEKLPLYLSFFEFIHNVRRRGKALLASLLAVLVAP